MVFAYLRVSTEKQDLNKQRHVILEWAHSNKTMIDEFVEIEISSKETLKDRCILELFEKMQSGDTLVMVEISRLGRNMLETLNLIESFFQKGITLIFVRQPVLSTDTNNPFAPLLRAVFGFFAETERGYISLRTKQGLEAAKASGKKLGRPPGAKNKVSKLDGYIDKIEEYVGMRINSTNIAKLLLGQYNIKVSIPTVAAIVKEIKLRNGKKKKA